MKKGFHPGILPRSFAVSADISPIGALIDVFFELNSSLIRALDLGRLLLSLVRSVADAVNQKHVFCGGYSFRIKE